MNEKFWLFNPLSDYIFRRLEVSPNALFRQSDLELVSPDHFKQFKEYGLLIEEYKDPEDTTYIDDEGIRRFVRKIQGQFWAYSMEREVSGGILLSPSQLKYFRFSLIKYLIHLQKVNDLTSKISEITNRIFFIGNNRQQNSFYLGLFCNDRTAESELLTLRFKIGLAEHITVICPTYGCPQNLLSILNSNNIDCVTFSNILDQNGIIQYRSSRADVANTLRFLDGKSNNRAYFVQINNEKCSIPYAQLVLLIYFVIQLKNGKTGIVNKDMTDKEGITDSSDDANITHLYSLISGLKKSFRQFSNLIKSEGEGYYQLDIPLQSISYPSDKWLNDKYNDLLTSLDKERERRKKQKNNNHRYKYYKTLDINQL